MEQKQSSNEVNLGEILPKEASLEEISRSTRQMRAFAIISWTRILAAVPAFGLLLISAVLISATTLNVIHATAKAFLSTTTLVELAVEYIEFTDAYLLAIALFIMGLGIFSLFITDKIPLPKWLEFHDFDDLKERLVSVIIVMLGVYFLGEVLKGAQGIDLLWLGLSICAIVLSLTLFASLVIKNNHIKD
ncbi:MAG: YqhA family protein [Eggerthellaceae bacterium]|nr:YqhA family protein [Eggerthellaceae bacterium]